MLSESRTTLWKYPFSASVVPSNTAEKPTFIELRLLALASAGGSTHPLQTRCKEPPHIDGQQSEYHPRFFEDTSYIAVGTSGI
jgi:predicted secreted protein